MRQNGGPEGSQEHQNEANKGAGPPERKSNKPPFSTGTPNGKPKGAPGGQEAPKVTSEEPSGGKRAPKVPPNGLKSDSGVVPEAIFEAQQEPRCAGQCMCRLQDMECNLCNSDCSKPRGHTGDHVCTDHSLI